MASGQSAVFGYLEAADGIDDNAGGVGAIPDLQLAFTD